MAWQYLDMRSTLGLVIHGVISSNVKWSYAQNRPSPTTCLLVVLGTPQLLEDLSSHE